EPIQDPGGRRDVEAFLAGYRRFAEEAVRLDFVRYENFVEDPNGALTTLCERLSLDFDCGTACNCDPC
ncbi:MAG: hypothetical protein QF786_11700, partial [Vicinamibacterales bacterium]|nr:hypothetical protein [Vicinamibacterales bacterium]